MQLPTLRGRRTVLVVILALTLLPATVPAAAHDASPLDAGAPVVRELSGNTGSETPVFSLGDVDDLATRDLMKAYYTALLSGAGRAEALQSVQLKRLSSSHCKHPAF